MIYSIIDIEATNGPVGTEKIIDIAVYQFNGEEVTDQFISLVNPEKEIDKHVVYLTKITNKMVRTAPKFYELAKRILEITQNTILVGHNVNFDERMLRQELEHLGYLDFKHETIDTLSLSQKLLPNEVSYSLGKLCKSLGVPVTKRHRAFGDAMATLQLFQILRQKDSYKEILQNHLQPKEAKKKPKRISLSQKHLKLLKNLPNEVGVYYLLNQENEVFYIGKSKNIAQRVSQHFTAKDQKSKMIQSWVDSIEFELTGNELIALIKENHEIQSLQPKLNQVKKKRLNKHWVGLYVSRTKEGYKRIYIQSISQNHSKPLFYFSSKNLAKQKLFQITKELNLCWKVNELYPYKTSCFAYDLEECYGACIQKENAENYNIRIDHWLEEIRYDWSDFLILNQNERTKKKSFLWIESGVLKGYGFYEIHAQITSSEKRSKHLISVKETQEMKFLILKYLREKPNKQLLRL